MVYSFRKIIIIDKNYSIPAISFQFRRDALTIKIIECNTFCATVVNDDACYSAFNSLIHIYYDRCLNLNNLFRIPIDYTFILQVHHSSTNAVFVYFLFDRVTHKEL